MANFGNVVKNNNYQNLTRTENQAVALKSTESALLDLFATVGALRAKDYDYICEIFDEAFAEDKLLATKLMFYARNVRGGLGERQTFRNMLKYLAEINPEIVEKNMSLIPHFGRWDDLYVLVGTPVERKMWKFVEEQFYQDLSNMKNEMPVSLLGKWLKSVNTSSSESRRLGKMTARALGFTDKIYRQILSKLRRYIDVVETKMSAGEWETISYNQVPSNAMKNYRNAFMKHDEKGFNAFMNKVEKGFNAFMNKVENGETEIKATTLYPYEILEKANLSSSFSLSDSILRITEDRVLEAQWKALPNYIEGENNVLVMADTSGSMEGRPLATSVGLAVYFAERNKGAYKDLFMTFSMNPRFVKLSGNTLAEKVSKIEAEVANTDLERAFQLILDVAIRNNVSKEEMPKSLIIITDMHFDYATAGGSDLDTFYQKMRQKFSLRDYEMPTVIFWNVDQRENAFQVTKNEKNVILVSGQATSTFRNVLANIGCTPYEFMLNTLNSPQYDSVKV